MKVHKHYMSCLNVYPFVFFMLSESKSDGTLLESDFEEGMEYIELVDENVQIGGNAETNFYGSPLKPMQAATAMTETDPLRLVILYTFLSSLITLPTKSSVNSF